VSREWYPERLVVVDELPRSSGGKVAKGDLKADARDRAAALAAEEG
jgi:acyl-CoA synthetase